MMNLKYVLKNFFTHKDYLVDANLIPGTMYSKMHIVIECIFVIVIIVFAKKVAKKPQSINKSFKYLWYFLIILEILIIIWDTFARKNNGIDFINGLSLYPCSIFLYALPLYIWGNNKAKKMAIGYFSTLGLVGMLINLIYPYRLEFYSIISFPAMHSIFYHGSMLFVFLVLLFSKEKIYKASKFKDLFYPCILTLIMSIPANILNYFVINSDYMYFKGYHPFAKAIINNVSEVKFTFILYLIYIFGPLLLYLPSYLKNTFFSKVYIRT